MHLHEKPKGSGEKTATAGQPCKIGECNQSNSGGGRMGGAKRYPSTWRRHRWVSLLKQPSVIIPRDFSAVASDTQGLAPSFRGDAKHRTRNLFHRRACGSMDSGLAPRGAPRNDGSSRYARNDGYLLPPRTHLLGRALRGFRELGGDRGGLGGGAPARCIAAVAPGAWP